MADRAVMIALGTKLGPQTGAAQQQGIINRLASQAANVFSGSGVGGSILAGGMAGGIAGAMVALAQSAASKFAEAFEAHMKAVGEVRRFKAYFGALTPLATEWATELSKATGYCERDIGALMGQIYNMARGLDMSTGEAANLTQQFSKLALDFAAFQGMSPAEAFQTLQGAIAGRFRALTQYGIILTEGEKQSLEAIKKTGDEAAYTAKVIAVLSGKMQVMAGAASMEGPGKELREYNTEVEDLKVKLGAIGKIGVQIALGWKNIFEGLAALPGHAARALGMKDEARAAVIADAVAAVQARAALNARNVAEFQVREIARAAAEEKVEAQAAFLHGLDAEMNAEVANAAAIMAAREKVSAHDAEELRNKLRKGGYDDLLAEKSKKLLDLDEKRIEKAKKLAEEREREKEHLAEQFGMMSALERVQAKNVLERLKAGGMGAYMGFGEKELRYAKEFAPETAKDYARRITERELGPGFAAQALGKVNVQAVLKNEITAKLEIDGPSLAQQITDKVWPLIQELINSSIGALTGTIRVAQSAGQAITGAASL